MWRRRTRGGVDSIASATGVEGMAKNQKKNKRSNDNIKQRGNGIKRARSGAAATAPARTHQAWHLQGAPLAAST